MVPAPSASKRFAPVPFRRTTPAAEGAPAGPQTRRRFALRPAPLLLAALALAMPAAASAGEPKASLSIERHHPSNALDGPLALDDRYWLLRGALEDTIAHDFGATRIVAEFEARRYDLYDFENDAGFALTVETTVRPSDALELRGTLSWRRAH